MQRYAWYEVEVYGTVQKNLRITTHARTDRERQVLFTDSCTALSLQVLRDVVGEWGGGVDTFPLEIDGAYVVFS